MFIAGKAVNVTFTSGGIEPSALVFEEYTQAKEL